MLVWYLCCVCMRLWLCLYGDCGRSRGCMHVCECVCVYCGCVVFACVSGHVCVIICGVCVYVCMLVKVCGNMVVVLCLYVSLAMFV